MTDEFVSDFTAICLSVGLFNDTVSSLGALLAQRDRQTNGIKYSMRLSVARRCWLLEHGLKKLVLTYAYMAYGYGYGNHGRRRRRQRDTHLQYLINCTHHAARTTKAR